MRRRFIAVCVLPVALGGLDAAATDLEAILDRNSEAHGGSAYERIESVRVELLISELAYQVRGSYLATRDGLVRIDIFAGENRIFAEGVSADCTWSWNPRQPNKSADGCVNETDTDASTLKHGVELPGLFYTLKDVRDRGAEVELLGSVGTESGPEWQLRVTLEDGFTQDYFIDQVSYLITRSRDFRAFNPAVDPTEVLIETRFEAPSWVEGVLRFGRQVNVNVGTDQVLGTTSVLALEFNPEVSAEMFDRRYTGAR